MDEAAANKQRTLEFFAAMNRADADAIAETYAEDGRLRSMGNTLISGTYAPAQIREFARGVLDSFPEGLEFNISAITAEENRVAVEAASGGRHISGAMYENHHHFLLTWEKGKLKEMKEYMDTEMVTDVICGGQRPG